MCISDYSASHDCVCVQVAQFAVEEGACHPARGWAQQSGGQYYPSTPRGNLFAFESEDRFVLTCAQQQALIYEVSGPQYIVTHYPQHFRGGGKGMYVKKPLALACSGWAGRWADQDSEHRGPLGPRHVCGLAARSPQLQHVPHGLRGLLHQYHQHAQELV